jgi:hypothetical protein
MLASDLVQSALRLINVVASGETPSSDEAADGLVVLNQLLASWNTEELSVYGTTNQQFTTTANVQNYSYGQGANWNATRPVKIHSAGIVSGGLRQPLELIGAREWAAIPERALTGNLPMKLYSDNAYPSTNIFLWPRPAGAVIVDLYVFQEFAAFTAGDTFDLPPGYARAIRYCLACDLAPEYGRAVPPDVAETARMAKAALVKLNASSEVGKNITELPGLPPVGAEAAQ